MSKFKSFNLIMPVEAWIFIFFFFYVLVGGLVVQFFLLPATFLHAGDGLMIGGDWINFHNLALKHAAEIREFGWSVAELKQGRNSPSGFAAIVYAITGITKPWILLPIHGVLFAVAAVGLFWVIHGLSNNYKVALLALTPMVLMPSLVMVWSQLHKDIWSISSILLLLGFWLRLFSGRQFSMVMTFIVLSFINFSLWWMRPYSLQIIFMGQLLLFIFLFLFIIFFRRALTKTLAYAFGALFCTYFFLNHGVMATSYSVKEEPSAFACENWSLTLPIAGLDYKLKSLACTRDRVISRTVNAASNVDADINFLSAKDVFNYAPRAIQIGVFSPFPNMWFSKSNLDTGQVFRIVAGLETIFIYVALVGIFAMLCLIFFRQAVIGVDRSVAFIALLTFSIIWVGVYALASVNVGTLYRVRFPIMLLWMALGIWSWSQILSWYKSDFKVANETVV